MAKAQKLKNLQIGEVKKLKSADTSTLVALKSMEKNFDEALRKGQEYRKTSKKKWGGSNQPMNP
jgi:hypothetical protein